MSNRVMRFRVWDNVDYMSKPFTFQDLTERKIEFTSDCPVMQSTELTDANNQEIYEGDVVSYEGILFVVRFGCYIEAWGGECPKNGHNAVGWFICDEDEKNIKSLLTDWSLPKMEDLLIMGNVYEEYKWLNQHPTPGLNQGTEDGNKKQ